MLLFNPIRCGWPELRKGARGADSAPLPIDLENHWSDFDAVNGIRYTVTKSFQKYVKISILVKICEWGKQLPFLFSFVFRNGTQLKMNCIENA